MTTTFKGFSVENIEDAMNTNLKKAVIEKVTSKLDGMLNTEDAYAVDGNSTIYFTKGLYKGLVDGRSMEDVHFVMITKKGSVGICSTDDIY